MGKRGPKPTPTAVLKLRGSWLADARKGEPQVEIGAPDPPESLTPAAKVAWDAIVPRLDRIPGLLAKIDGNALERYCETWSRWRSAIDAIARDGESCEIKDDDGETKYIQQRPEVSIANQLAGQLAKLEQSFGLTPAARAGITVQPASKRDDKDGKDKKRFFRSG